MDRDRPTPRLGEGGESNRAFRSHPNTQHINHSHPDPLLTTLSAAALVILAILTVQGIGFLLPTNLKVYFEIRKPNPDPERIGRLMKWYIYVVAMQGAMQVAIIVVMARFATGL